MGLCSALADGRGTAARHRPESRPATAGWISFRPISPGRYRYISIKSWPHLADLSYFMIKRSANIGDKKPVPFWTFLASRMIKTPVLRPNSMLQHKNTRYGYRPVRYGVAAHRTAMSQFVCDSQIRDGPRGQVADFLKTILRTNCSKFKGYKVITW